MKVGFVAQPYDGVLPPNQNSIGLIIYNTALETARLAQVSIFCKHRDTTPDATGLPIKVEAVSAPIDDAVQSFAAKYPRWAARFGIAPLVDDHGGYVSAVRRRVQQRGCDVLHVMNYWSWSERLRDRSGRRPLVLEMQSEWLSQMEVGAVARQLQAVSAVVCVSEHIAKLFRTAMPSYRGVVATAYNGVDLDTFQPLRVRQQSSVAPRLLFVGRVSPEKGVHTLIEAFARVRAAQPQAQLDIAGPRTILPERLLVGISSDPLVKALARFYDGSLAPDYQRYLDGLVERLHLKDAVRFLGAIPHKELVAAYQAADVVVNPSLSESFGISMVEGMACGKPVVGTKVGGMLETVLDGATGRVVDADRPDLLGDAILEMLNDRSRAETIGAAGRDRAVEHFSWRARAERLMKVYESVR